MRLIRATGALLESLLDDTFPLWGDGLTRKGYGHWNIAQERTDWGTRHLRRFALMDGARVLSSAKRYDLSLWLKGRRVSALGVGAVFTPESQRGHGHAPAIIKALEDQARGDGAEVSLLFSEIGPDYYARLGYTQIPLQTVEVEVDEKDGAPAMLVRAGEDSRCRRRRRDARSACARLPPRAAAGRGAGALFRLQEAHVRRPAARARAGRSSTSSSEEGHQAVAFLLIQVTRGVERAARHVEHRGVRRSRPVRRAHRRDAASPARPRSIRAAPRSSAPGGPTPLRPPQLRIIPRQPAGEVMMLKPLAPGVTLDAIAPDGVMYWHGDVF